MREGTRENESETDRHGEGANGRGMCDAVGKEVKASERGKVQNTEKY